MARTKKAKAEVESILKDELTSNEPIMHKDSDKLECEVLVAFFDKYTDKLKKKRKKYKFTYKRIKEIKAKNEKFIKVIDE